MFFLYKRTFLSSELMRKNMISVVYTIVLKYLIKFKTQYSIAVKYLKA